MSNAWGMDISVWQDLNSTAQMVDFQKAKNAGMHFVYIKASQGTYMDPDYQYNWKNAKGILYRGAYHFLTWDKSPVLQAGNFWNLLKDDPGELPLMIDFEWWRETPPNAIQVLYGFTERLRQLTTRPIGIYTANSFWRQYGNQASYWKQFYLWICDINGPVEVPAPWLYWTFHQYTFKLHGPTFGAESQDLDGDWYNGTVELLRQEFGIEQPATYKIYNPVVMG